MAIPMICMVVIFYFMAIRPQSKRAKDLANLVSALKTGDKVVTSSGIHGIISNVKEGSTLMLKIADNVKIEIDKSFAGRRTAARTKPPGLRKVAR